MADLEKSVRTRLLAHTGVANIISRRAWYSYLEIDAEMPTVTIQEISAVPEGVMGDDAGIVDGRVQVDSYAETRDAAKALGEQVRDALQRWRGSAAGSVLTFVGMNSGGVRFEPEGRIWRHRQDFSVWFTEAVT